MPIKIENNTFETSYEILAWIEDNIPCNGITKEEDFCDLRLSDGTTYRFAKDNLLNPADHPVIVNLVKSITS